MNIDNILRAPSREELQRDNEAAQLGKDDFLRLLTVQLRYQDPLNPMQDTDFIAQMAQFSSLEQLQNMNRSLDKNLGSDEQLNTAFNNNIVTALVGKTVEIPTVEIEFDGDKPSTVSYRLDAGARSAKLQILDGRSQLVREFDLDITRPRGSVEWDGKRPLRHRGVSRRIQGARAGRGHLRRRRQSGCVESSSRRRCALRQPGCAHLGRQSRVDTGRAVRRAGRLEFILVLTEESQCWIQSTPESRACVATRSGST